MEMKPLFCASGDPRVTQCLQMQPHHTSSCSDYGLSYESHDALQAAGNAINMFMVHKGRRPNPPWLLSTSGAAPVPHTPPPGPTLHGLFRTPVNQRERYGCGRRSRGLLG